MKKILLTVLFLFMVMTSAKATTNYFDVTFDEFCPLQAMVNIDTSKDYFWAYKKYWKERKINFEERKAKCASQETDEQKSECFLQLREYEKNLTQQYLQLQQARAASYSSTQTRANTFYTVPGPTYNYNSRY